MRFAGTAVAELRSWCGRLGQIRLADRELMLILLGVSFALRLAVWGWVVGHDVPLRGDEIGYYGRATGFSAILSHLAVGRWPEAAFWIHAYGEGKWTPVHSLLISLGMVMFGESAAVARFVVVLLASATTPLVYVLARQLVSRRAALVAAAIHAGYPTFVAYAHFLWTESTFTFFLVIALIAALRAREVGSEARRIRSCALSGLMLGVCFLVKSSAIFLMPVVPLWLVLRTQTRREGLRAAAAFVLAWAIPWGAWSVPASTVEGRFVPALASSGYVLYLGNNPWMPPGLGTYASPETRQRMDEAIGVLVETSGRSPDEAAAHLARAEFLGHPLGSAARVLRRVQEFWFPDNFALAHLYRGYYPPVAAGWGLLAGLLVVGCYLAFMLLAGRGLLAPGPVSRDVKALVLGLVVMMLVPSLPVVAQSRYHLPALVILLPFVALAIERIRLPLPPKRQIAWITASVAFLVMCAEGLPNLVRHHLRSSSAYAGVFRPLAGVLGTDLHFMDQLAFRPQPGTAPRHITFDLVGSGAAFLHTGTARATWDAAQDPPAIQALVHCDLASTPLRLRITVDGDPEGAVVIEPLAACAWRTWQPTPAGIEYRWDPTSAVVPTRVYFPSWPGATRP